MNTAINTTSLNTTSTNTSSANTVNMAFANARLLAKNIYVDNNTHNTQLNNNDLIIGPAGAGKTRGYVMPNILSGNESLIVTDTKNSLRRFLQPYLMQQGIAVYNIDFSGISHSTVGYNPFDNIDIDINGNYSERDVLCMAEQLAPIHNTKDIFWDISAKYVIASMIAYVMECFPKDQRNIAALAKLAGHFDEYEYMLSELSIENENSLAIKYYNVLKATGSAEKMRSSIISVIFEKLTPLDNSAANNLYNAPERISFEKLSSEKSVLFLNVSDSDRSSDVLVSLFYAQALHSLMTIADMNEENHLQIPVRLILDDFAAGTTIADFDKIISVIRSRDIYVSIILQSLSQLEALYSAPCAKTIINNCDHWLYLGGQDIDTIEQISLKSNKMPVSIANLPLDKVLLFERGKSAQIADKFDISLSPVYDELTALNEEHRKQKQMREAAEAAAIKSAKPDDKPCYDNDNEKDNAEFDEFPFPYDEFDDFPFA